jgi:hypothetical protein
MMWKTVVKNGIRTELPQLAPLMTHPEQPDELAAADSAGPVDDRDCHRRRLFATGREVPPPVGPLAYDELHALSITLYDGRGLSELSGLEMANLADLVSQANSGDEDAQNDIDEILSAARAGAEVHHE